MHAILLVGGRGTRLMPHTSNRPKALMPLGEHSLLEISLRRLRACGFTRATLCISHLGSMIRSAFGDGSQLGLRVDYCVDDRPMGTAAPLLLVPDWTEPAVVMNGDLLTSIDFGELYRRHVAGDGGLTVAFQRYWVSTGVGLLRADGDRIRRVHEKPTFEWNVCCGIYVADPGVRSYIPSGTPTDMPTLINALADAGVPVNGYAFHESWHDVGTPARYEQARADFLSDPDRYLGSAPSKGAADRPRPELDVFVLDEPVPGSSTIEMWT
ncbi:sugar phosphate nucleotidyltransferase [Micromonospora sp. KC723]|uniref:sugar phosphate nucleotidyltransferase n=1 Tax=Micromonospora sp. KC723 TaxID=2530381 RepID=UPI0010475C72|nr:sugar phosphate nucleotidyltransferase [Micromonospora sp. KC723]TDB74896.1 nucleotidyl transferase [Micromonospora sp. KC723]